MRGTKVIQALAGLAGLGICGSAHALEWYFQEPGSRLASDIDWLHQLVMWLIIVIFAVVFGAMFYACYAHRKSKGHEAEQFHENTTVELVWTIVRFSALCSGSSRYSCEGSSTVMRPP